VITRNGKHSGGTGKLDGISQTLIHGAEEGATKVAEVAETAGARITRGAGELSGQLKNRSPLDLTDAKHTVKDAQLSMRKTRLNLRERAMRSMGRRMVKQRAGLLPSGDAMLKAQLVKTSRELAHESSDLNAAVDSLNQIIKSNRRAAAKGRTRLLGGLALGAALMYHLDADQGRQRRAATARMLANVARGERQTPAA
jgi:hypothetical protein